MYSDIEYDLIITNDISVTASDVAAWDLAIKDETIILQTPSGLLSGVKVKRVIDAEGAYITPGGVDCHVHLEEPAMFIKGSNAQSVDTWETGTRSAVAGRNATIVAFALQLKSEPSLIATVKRTHDLAAKNCYCDYGFYVLMSDPNPEALEELQVLKEEQCVWSVKIYTTYTALQLRDDQILNVLLRTRSTKS